jgi:peroxiredoxin
LLLAFVLFVAALTKLADRKGSREALVGFGVPSFLAGPLGFLLPLIELAAAAALIPAGTAWWGAVGALALLLLFIAGIGTNLALGRKPNCHCFGQLHSAPAGWKTLTRNGVLAVVAGFVVWQGYDGAGPSVVSWLGKLSAAQSVALVAGLVVLGLFAVQWWLLIHLLRQNGRLLVRLEALEANLVAGGAAAPSQNGTQPAPGLPVGSTAPTFKLQGLYGETLTLESLRASDKPVMLLFTDPNCGPCTALLPEIRRWQKEHAEELTISLISRGSVEQNRAKCTEHGLGGVLLQKEWEVAHVYEAHGTPSAVLVGPDGKIASPVAQGSDDIRALVTKAAQGRVPTQSPLVKPQPQGGVPCPNCGKVHPTNGNGHTHPVTSQGSKVGEPAPPIELEDLKGNTIKLEDFAGEKTLVLFWNPGCGFCQQMLPDLKQWENSPPEGAPKLLVVSAGAVEANKEMNLSSTVVLDQEFATGRAFGTAGTPSAVLVDEEGKIASEVAVGAPAVLELAGVVGSGAS